MVEAGGGRDMSACMEMGVCDGTWGWCWGGSVCVCVRMETMVSR